MVNGFGELGGSVAPPTPPPSPPASPQKRLSRQASRAIDPGDMVKYTYFDLRMRRDNGALVTLPCQWLREGQHTLAWTSALTLDVAGEEKTLRPGSCNLYKFPRVKFSHFMSNEEPELLEGADFAMLVTIFKATVEQQYDVWEQPDAAGEPATGAALGRPIVGMGRRGRECTHRTAAQPLPTPAAQAPPRSSALW